MYKNYLILLKIIIYGILTGLLFNYPNFCLSIFMLLELSYAMIYLFKKPYSDVVQNIFYAVGGVFHVLGLLFIVIISQQ